MLGGELVLVEEASEPVAATDVDHVSWIDRRWRARGGGLLVEAAVGPVVVRDVDAEHALEVLASEDQDLVEALAAEGSDPALGDRVASGTR